VRQSRRDPVTGEYGICDEYRRGSLTCPPPATFLALTDSLHPDPMLRPTIHLILPHVLLAMWCRATGSASRPRRCPTRRIAEVTCYGELAADSGV
jgi:hypothetical protein